MGYPNWRTPTKPGSILAGLKEEFKFTFDAAASHANTKFDRYCTEEGKWERVGSGVKKLADTDGLNPLSWKDEVAFWNPPYVGDTISDWLQIANDEHALTSVGLLPPSTDTKWFHEMWPESQTAAIRDNDRYHSVVFYKAKGTGPLLVAREIRFYKKREKFERPKTLIPIYEDGVFVYSEFDESDPESVPGPSPRAGNIVLVVNRV